MTEPRGVPAEAVGELVGRLVRAPWGDNYLIGEHRKMAETWLAAAIDASPRLHLLPTGDLVERMAEALMPWLDDDEWASPHHHESVKEALGDVARAALASLGIPEEPS